MHVAHSSEFLLVLAKVGPRKQHLQIDNTTSEIVMSQVQDASAPIGAAECVYTWIALLVVIVVAMVFFVYFQRSFHR